MTPYSNVSFADALDTLAVKVEDTKRPSAYSGQGNDLEPVTRPEKVFFPRLRSWVEESNLLPRIRVGSPGSTTFTTITVKAGECEVFGRRLASQTHRNDVVDGKGNVLPGFVCMAVFAQSVCSRSDLGLKSNR